MLLRLLLTTLHLLAIVIAIPAIWNRSRALLGDLDRDAYQRAVRADTRWGLAIGLWLLTGFARAFTTIEQGPQFYFGNGMFLAKMALFALILFIELLSMFTFMRWRAILKDNRLPDPKSAPLIARLSQAQLLLTLLAILTAAATALNITF